MITRNGLKAFFFTAVIAVCCHYADGVCQARVMQANDTVPARANQRLVAMTQTFGGVVAGCSLTGLCDALGIAWKWDLAAAKLTCNRQGRRIEFVAGMPFFLANDTLLQLAAGPVRLGGMLYLPAGLCVEAVAHVMSDSVAWHIEDSTFVVTPRTPAPAVSVTQGVDTEAVHTQASAGPSAAEPVKKPKVPQEALKTIVIDPGHGGMDPGAIGPGGLQEKGIVLDIALLVRDEIKKEPNLTVYMTRERDVFIPLQDRTKFANTKKADLFVSIHANSIEGNAKKRDNTKGFKVYFLSQAKNEDDKLVAMRENAVIKLEDKTSRYDNLQDILIDMAGNEYLRESQDFSFMISETFHSCLRQIPRLQLGVGQANFWVLNGAYMPSVLIEVGFISNRREEESLKDPAVQKSIAAGIYDAIMSFKKKYESEL
jgi:N-acetylmuramoyl-L-alanine amidase